VTSDRLTMSIDQSLGAPRQARRFTVAALESWGLDALVDDLTLLVSELVSNVIHHTEAGATLALARRHDRVRVSVVDQGGGKIRPRRPSPDDPSGRGLLLVDRIATRWGSVNRRGRTEVWFEVLIPD
jgi:anti-sigma regulatory factor (Ser/Thr protein kinase)